MLLKLHVREPESEAIAALVAGQQLCSSRLAMLEFQSALLRLEREKKLTEEIRTGALSRFRMKWSLGYFHLVPLNHHVLARASQIMLACHPVAPMKTLDALHLASFEESGAGALVTTDKQMRTAAQHLGFTLENP